jgi:hypothetical protein
MSKLPNKRQKGYNYTARHDALQKNVQLVQEGKLNVDSPKSLLMASGYTESSAEATLSRKDRNGAIRELLGEIWPMEDVVTDMKRIQKGAESSEKYGDALKAIDMRLKMGGEYAAVKQELEVSGTIEHEHNYEGGTDYLEFRKERIAQKEIIDGEVVG